MISKVKLKKLALLIEKSKTSPRKRAPLPLHPYEKEGIRAVLNCIQPESYVRPHQHPSPYNGSEIWVPIQGRIAAITFDLMGNLKEINYISKENLNDCAYIEIKPDTYHTAISLEPDSIILEFSRGPYDPKTYKTFATWAPPEEEVESSAQYLQKLKDRLL